MGSLEKGLSCGKIREVQRFADVSVGMSADDTASIIATNLCVLTTVQRIMCRLMRRFQGRKKLILV